MSENITVVYDGDALKEHLIDVNDLAPSLLAISDLVNSAGQVIYGSNQKISVKIKAVKKGSFEVKLFIDILQQGVNFLNSHEIDAIKNLLELLGYGGGAIGLYRLIVKLKGKKPKTIINLGNGGDVTFIDDDGKEIVVKSDVAKLYSSKQVLDDAEKVLKPLKSKGIDTFKIIKDKKEILKVDADEVKYFNVPPQQEREVILDDTMERTFTIHALSFEGGDKWKVSDGETVFPVIMKDRRFISRIDNNEPFTKGNLLKVLLRTIQYKDSTGKLKTEYEILEVLKNDPPSQLLLGIKE
jgi:hypothetical protein